MFATINNNEMKNVDPWTGSILQLYNPRGKKLEQKFYQSNNWVKQREELGTWPFGMLNYKKESSSIHLNFSLFDYIGLSKHPEVLKAAQQVISEYGISSSSSPSLNGRTEISQQLENKTAQLLNKETCLLYPSGWAACYGAITGIANARDTIIIDQLAHNCLATAAKSVTNDLLKFRHNDSNHLKELLEKSRTKNAENCLLIVLESLYSMNATSPDLPKVMELANQYEAIVVIDVAHELGTRGSHGFGILEDIDTSADNIIIAGSYSKVFGTNGGFVAGPACIRNQFLFFSPTYVYSSAMSPLQCAIILKSLDIAFSPEGDILRNKLNAISSYARQQFTKYGFEIDGDSSAILPVIIGDERKSREIFPHLLKNGLLVNLIEFPVVQKGRSLFRFLLSPLMSFAEIDEAVETLVRAKEELDHGLILELNSN
ncbi:MAG: pyridoxal phosphate-dependent aminotransferase family protein [Saprospiraceae bacterium]